jgi:hypothetical protein
MATNTRGSARRAQGERGETESRDRTEGAGSRSRVASEAAASRGDRDESLPAPPSRAHGAEFNEDDEVASDADFTAEEDELEHYAGLAQEELEERIQRAKTQVMRKRKERELVQLRKELRGEPTAGLRDADKTTALLEQASKRLRLSENDNVSRLKRNVRPAEPLYYYSKNVKELKEFLIFWVI